METIWYYDPQCSGTRSTFLIEDKRFPDFVSKTRHCKCPVPVNATLLTQTPTPTPTLLTQTQTPTPTQP